MPVRKQKTHVTTSKTEAILLIPCAKLCKTKSRLICLAKFQNREMHREHVAVHKGKLQCAYDSKFCVRL